MKKRYIILILVMISNLMFSQEYTLKSRYLFGTFHTKNTTIHGISFGAFPNFTSHKRFVKTNGLRLEIPGLGFLAPLGNGSLVTDIEKIELPYKIVSSDYDEIINGINISSGTVGSNIVYNGLTLGLVAQFGVRNNGLAISGLWNAMNVSNGIQASFLLNESLKNNGIQFSLSNTSVIMKGIQIGSNNHISQKGIGLQIGLYNTSKGFRGFQVGLWNKNEKRSLPIINWNFKN